MGNTRYNPEQKHVLDSLLLDVPGITTGQMFGHPNYKIAGKIFACLMPEGVALKLPDAAVQQLLAQDNTAPFAPGGPIMRQWVQINLPNPADYAAYMDFFRQAIEYVLDLATNSGPKSVLRSQRSR